jgi:peptidoglycan/xylan/chitin deacetylase (PgdA/CDA1 family)
MSTPTAERAGAVGLTFDDGNQSDSVCARVLEALGYSALFFIPTEYVGRNGRLSKADIVDLARCGMGIGSHGHQHVPLPRLDDEKLGADLRHSKTTLEDIIGSAIDDLSFPAGAYDERVVSMARRVGYKRFYTSDWGSNGAREMASGVLRRTAVVDGLTTEAFEDILRGRHRRMRQAQFRLKEAAKRGLGEHNYVRLRRFLNRPRTIAD